MQQVQTDFERGVADEFVAWYNARTGRNYRFMRRLDNPRPDVRYIDSSSFIDFEVTSEYYNEHDARRKWGPRRGRKAAQPRFEKLQLEERLSQILVKKCQKDYPPNTVLLMYVEANLHCSCEVKRLQNGIVVPGKNPFAGIYLVGHFGECGRSSCRSLRLVKKIQRNRKSCLFVRGRPQGS